MDTRDLALMDAVYELALWEERYVQTLAEAATYRGLLQHTLALWREDAAALESTRERLRQVMGREAWHEEEDDPRNKEQS